MQKHQRPRVTTLVVFMFFSACPHLHACLHLLSLALCDCQQYKFAQSSHIFSYKKYILHMKHVR